MWTGSTSIEFIEGEPGIVVGWGLGGFNTTKQMSTTSTVPKIISTPVVSNNVCFAANPKYKSLTSNRTFCAGIMYDQLLYTKSLASKPLVFNKQLHQGPCTGDSGAGLMIFRNNRWVLRGTVSGSLPMFEMQTKRTKSRTATRSCSINQYVVYTDVAKFLDWIFAFVLWSANLMKRSRLIGRYCIGKWISEVTPFYVSGEEEHRSASPCLLVDMNEVLFVRLYVRSI